MSCLFRMFDINALRNRYGNGLVIFDQEGVQHYFIDVDSSFISDYKNIHYDLKKIWIDKDDVVIDYRNKKFRFYVSINPIDRDISSVQILKYQRRKFGPDRLLLNDDLFVQKPKPIKCDVFG